MSNFGGGSHRKDAADQGNGKKERAGDGRRKPPMVVAGGPGNQPSGTMGGRIEGCTSREEKLYGQPLGKGLGIKNVSEDAKEGRSSARGGGGTSRSKGDDGVSPLQQKGFRGG